MKAIVDDAKPIVVSTIHLHNVWLSLSDQRRLASWLALAAIMTDVDSEGEMLIDRADLAFLWTNKIPPPHWYIGIGAYLGPDRFASAHSTAFQKLDDRLAILHTITAVVGGMFAIVSVHNPGRDSVLLAQLSYSKELTQIWPSSGNSIPSPNYAKKIVTGTIDPDGGRASELSTMLAKKISDHIKGVGR